MVRNGMNQIRIGQFFSIQTSSWFDPRNGLYSTLIRFSIPGPEDGLDGSDWIYLALEINSLVIGQIP